MPNEWSEYLTTQGCGAGGGGGTIYGGIDWAGFDAQAALAKSSWQAYQNYLKVREPYIQAGYKGLESLDRLMSGEDDISQSAGYQFRFGEGVDALERGASARGALFSGQQAKDLTQYGQDFAATEFGTEFQRRYNQAYAGVPVGFNTSYNVGAPDYPTLQTLQSKYGGMYGDSGGGGGGGGCGGGGGAIAGPVIGGGNQGSPGYQANPNVQYGGDGGGANDGLQVKASSQRQPWEAGYPEQDRRGWR